MVLWIFEIPDLIYINYQWANSNIDIDLIVLNQNKLEKLTQSSKERAQTFCFSEQIIFEMKKKIQFMHYTGKTHSQLDNFVNNMLSYSMLYAKDFVL